MFSCLKHLDFTSPSPQLYLDKRSRFKNMFGAILTIISFFFIFGFTTFLIVKLLMRENMTIIYNENSILNPFYNLTFFPLFFGVYDANGQEFSDWERLFSFNSKKYVIEDHFVNGKIQKYINISFMEIKRCEVFLNQTDSYYNNIDQEKSQLKMRFCLDFSNEFFLSGTMGDSKNQSFFSLNVDKCVNTTKKNDCFPPEYIDKVLGRPTFVLNFMDYIINNNNIYQPHTKYIRGEAISFNSQMLKIISYTFSNFEYNTDFGYIFNDIHQINFSKFTQSTIDSMLLAPGNSGILKLSFTLSKTKSYYNRYFEKFQNSMASISAISKIIIYFFTILNNLINEHFFFNYIANYLNLYENTRIKNENFNSRHTFVIKKKSKLNFSKSEINKLEINKKNATKNPDKEEFFETTTNNLNNFNKHNNLNLLNVENLKKSLETDTQNVNNFKTNKNLLEDISSEKISKKQNKEEIIIKKNFKNNLNNALNNENSNFNQIKKYDSSINKLNESNNKKNNKLGLKLYEVCCYRLMCKNNGKIETINIGRNYIKKKLSLEEIIRKMIEIDKIKFTLFEVEELNKLNKMKGPNIFMNESEINRNNQSKIVGNKNDMNNLWIKYEFEDNEYHTFYSKKSKSILNIAENLYKFMK